MERIRRRSMLAGMGAAVLARPALAQQFRGKELVAQGFGGPTQDVLQRVVFDVFDKREGSRSTQVPLQSAAAFSRMRAEAAAPQLDLYQFSGGQERLAAAEGLTAPLGALPGLADVPSNMKDAGGNWVTFAIIAEGILYRTDKVRTPPRSYKDFLDPVYEGHIALPTITNGYGTDFLVMLARSFGGSETNIEPGFQALAKVAKGASIFRAASEVPGLFAQGDAWIIPYDSTSAKRCKDAGLPVAFAAPEEGSVSSACSVCVAARSKNLEIARAMAAQFISPESQRAIAEQLQWAPTNGSVQLPDALARQLPRPDQLVTLNMEEMTRSRPQWTERWNREIGR
ncbi:MAG: extracellular solute-binding protein [Acetobacteraceae bacterium]|nr:extracellular solute-binding protein [Acetobacteraceae bacterium]